VADSGIGVVRVFYLHIGVALPAGEDLFAAHDANSFPLFSPV
jgi:hypothetical protein